MYRFTFVALNKEFQMVFKIKYNSKGNNKRLKELIQKKNTDRQLLTPEKILVTKKGGKLNFLPVLKFYNSIIMTLPVKKTKKNT